MPSSADARRYIRNAPLRLYGAINSVTTGCPIAAALTTPDAEVSKDGGAFTDLAAAETDIGGGFFSVDLSATETAAESITVQVKAANANAVTWVKVVDFEPCIDSGVATSAASSSITLASTAHATADLVNGAVIEIVRGTGKGQTRVIVDYSNASFIATVDRAWITLPSTDSVYIVKAASGVKVGTDIVPDANVTKIAGNSDAPTNLAALYKGGLITGAITSAVPTATQFDTDLVAGTGDLNDYLLILTSGTLKGRCQKISSFTATNGAIALYGTGVDDAPATSDTFVVLGRVI